VTEANAVEEKLGWAEEATISRQSGMFDEFFRSHRGESQLPIPVGFGATQWLDQKGNDGQRLWFG
jgi:hypothetical protein